MGEAFTPVAGYGTADYTGGQAVYITADKKMSAPAWPVCTAGEADSQYIQFEADRYYSGVDISGKRIQVHYERRDGVGGNSAPINVSVSDKRIRFGWVIPGRAAALDGVLKVMPFASGESPLGNAYMIKILYAEYTVRKGLAVSGGIDEPDDGWYQGFLRQMDSYLAEAEKCTGLAAGYAQDTAGYCSQAQGIVDSAKGSIEAQKNMGIGALQGQEAESIKAVTGRAEGALENIQAAAGRVSAILESAQAVEAGVGTLKSAAEAAQAGAGQAESNAQGYAALSKSYAVGTGGQVRENDGVENAQHYYEQIRAISENLSETLEAGLGAKAAKSTVVGMVLPASGWAGDEAPYTNTLAVAGVKPDSIVEVGLSRDAGIDEVKACMAGQLADGGQAEGSITLRAFGRKPDMDIPITVIVRGDV